MARDIPKLHIYFLPGLASGHMIPMIDIARQFAKNLVKSTIITTPLNATNFAKTIESDRENGSDISISLIKFPSKETGLPEGCENISLTTTPQMALNFHKALDLFQEPVEKLLEQNRPDCLVAGAFFWWATDAAHKFNIPRLCFYGTGFFPVCVHRNLKKHKPHEKVVSDSEEFVIPHLPDPVTMSRRQLSDDLKEENNHPMAELFKKIEIADLESYGVIVNSFNAMEPGYAKYYKEVYGKKAWQIGPVSLFNHRGNETEHNSSLTWLNSKSPKSVVYVCFGSLAIFSTAQMIEIAKGLEASGQSFIWAVTEKGKDEESIEYLEDFERRVEGRGLVLKGWAPQVLILEHESVGGFVTHCGWNSLLEGVAAGVAMVTWPLSADQFFNERLVIDVLKLGVPVGAREWTRRTDEREIIKGENIERAVAQLMVGEEAEIIRIRARKLGAMAKRAVEKGGSSYVDLKSFLEELIKGVSSLRQTEFTNLKLT